MKMIRRAAAYFILTTVYCFTYIAALLGSIIPRRSWKPTGRILVTGTFHNPNWYLSHLTPLARSGVKEVILVVDEPQLPLEGVRFACWPTWLSTLLGRTIARAVWVLVTGLRYRPDLYMGYHLGPGAFTILIVGKLTGRPACYQMTGGPVEIIGGGVYAAEGIGTSLGHASTIIETMALAVVRQYESVVVRGSKAKAFLASHRIEENVAIITGSVDSDLQLSNGDRDIHLIFVGRLVPVKNVHQFVAVVEAVSQAMPQVKATIVGDGPLMTDMKTKVHRSRLTNNIRFLGKIEDVRSVLACSKVFILTSQSEGLSIAMAEAMSAGAVPVVADVGELSDLVTSGVNGYLVESGNIDEYARRTLSLLQDRVLWTQCSIEAIETARRECDVEAVSGKWKELMDNTIARFPGCNNGL